MGHRGPAASARHVCVWSLQVLIRKAAFRHAWGPLPARGGCRVSEAPSARVAGLGGPRWPAVARRSGVCAWPPEPPAGARGSAPPVSARRTASGAGPGPGPGGRPASRLLWLSARCPAASGLRSVLSAGALAWRVAVTCAAVFPCLPEAPPVTTSFFPPLARGSSSFAASVFACRCHVGTPPMAAPSALALLRAGPGRHMVLDRVRSQSRSKCCGFSPSGACARRQGLTNAAVGTLPPGCIAGCPPDLPVTGLAPSLHPGHSAALDLGGKVRVSC